MKLISLKKFIDDKTQKLNKTDEQTISFIFLEKIDFLLMEFMESIMLKFLNEEASVDLNSYFFYFFTIFSCVNVYSKLSFSDLFYKINNDQILKRIFDACFDIDKYLIGFNIDKKFLLTIYFTIKLFILKISKSFSSLARNLQKMVLLLINTSTLIQFFFSVCTYIIDENNSEFFNVKNTLTNFNIIFGKEIVCQRDTNYDFSDNKNVNIEKQKHGKEYNNDLDSIDNSDTTLENFTSDDKYATSPIAPFSFQLVFENFFNILKKEVESNLRIDIQQECLSSYFSFYRSLLDCIRNNESVFEETLNEVLREHIASKFLTTEKKRKINSIKQLFNLLYLEVLNNNIERLIQKEMDLNNHINFRTSHEYLNITEDSKIYNFLEELSKENEFSEHYKILIQKANKIIIDFFKESEINITNNKESKKTEYKDFLDFISIKYSNRKTVE